METSKAVARFLTKCQERGLAPGTTAGYHSRLKPFVREFLQVPMVWGKVEPFLRERGETPAKRGPVFSAIQALYSYLEEFEDQVSPVPSRGERGRPSRRRRLGTNSAQVMHTKAPGNTERQKDRKTETQKPQAMTTAEAVKRFIDSRKAQGVSEKTVGKYEWIFGAFLQRFPELPLVPEEIEDYIRSLKGEPETRWTHQANIRALYSFLEQRFEFPNPMKVIPPVKVPRKVRKTLELEHLQKLLELDLSPRDKALISLLLDAGPRSGEIVGLDREDVFPGFIKVTGKTGQHQVPISPDTYELLVALAPTGPLFRTERGRMTRFNLYYTIKGLLEQIGVSGVKLGPHTFRHSFGRHYMALGGDLMSLKEVLGHTKVTTTQLYAELAFEDVQKIHRDQSVLRKLQEQNHVHSESEGQG